MDDIDDYGHNDGDDGDDDNDKNDAATKTTPKEWTKKTCKHGAKQFENGLKESENGPLFFWCVCKGFLIYESRFFNSFVLLGYV